MPSAAGPCSSRSSPRSPPTPRSLALLGRPARLRRRAPGRRLSLSHFRPEHRARLDHRQRGRQRAHPHAARLVAGHGKKQAHEIMGAVRTALHDQPLTLTGHRLDQSAPRVLRSPPRPRRRDHPRHRPLPRRDRTRVGVRPSGLTPVRVGDSGESGNLRMASRRLTTHHSPSHHSPSRALHRPRRPPPFHKECPHTCPPKKAKTSSSRSTATAPAPSSRLPACARARSPSTPRPSTSRTPSRPGQWRELLAGAGVKHARVTGAGIFKDAASDALVRQLRLRRHHPRLAGDHPRLRHRRGPVPDRRLRAHRPPRRRGRLRAQPRLRRRADIRGGVSTRPRPSAQRRQPLCAWLGTGSCRHLQDVRGFVTLVAIGHARCTSGLGTTGTMLGDLFDRPNLAAQPSRIADRVS